MPKGGSTKKGAAKKMPEMDYSGLSKGTRLQADGGDGYYYAAEVVTVATSAKRSKAPVKVHFAGYTAADDVWLGADGLRSKAIKPKKKEEAPGSCCPPGSAPYLAADHDDEGKVGEADGVSYYQVGSGEVGLLICPDIWGWNGGRCRALADEFAKKGMNVFVPKVLPAYQGGTDGDALPPDFNVLERGAELGPLVAGEWNPSKVVPRILKVVAAMKEAGVKRLAICGVCYGGWIGCKVSQECEVVCGVSPHPSMHMEGMIGGDPADLAKKTSCPWSLYPCGKLGAEGADPDIYDAPDGAFWKALNAKFPKRCRTKRIEKMAHGFWTRGAIKEGEFNAGTGDAVKVAVQECTEDMMKFFTRSGLFRTPRRFADKFFRKYDKATDGYVDSMGFMNRLPLRLQATNVVIHGLVNADKMWKEFDDEAYQPVLVGDKAIVTIFLNNFIDTDCGGSYLESWYNTVVTPKGTDQVKLEADKLADGLGAGSSFLMRVVCGDCADNPGAAMKAIAGGREVFGFPKHPNPGKIRFEYKEGNTKVEFDAEHEGKKAVEVRVTLPGVKKDGEKYPYQEIDALRLALDIKIPAEGIVSCPRLGGSHKGHNGAKQTHFAQHLCCDQHMAPWDAATDSIKFGDNSHYGQPIGRWDFTPVLKVHIPNFKIAAFKPNGWISGAAADKAVREHEKKIKEGLMAGAL